MKERINKLVELGLNYNKIAKMAGVPTTSLNDWCKGLRPSLSEANTQRLRVWLEEFKREVANI